MASKKISELSSSLAPPLSGVTAVVHGGTTYQSTLSTLRQTLVASGSHSFTGSQTINGDLTITGKIPSLIIGTGSFQSGQDLQPEILHVQNNGSYNIAHFEGNNQVYAQVNIKNTNSGTFASTDLVLTADNGNEIIHYVDLGINSSTYNGGAVGLANDSYLINSGKDMYVGTLGGSQHPAEVKLFTMGNWINPHITLHTGTTISFNTGSVSDGFEYEFSGSVKLKNELSVNGSVTASYFIGDGSQLTNLSSQTINTGSLATTGSNTFNGEQTISGSIIPAVGVGTFTSSFSLGSLTNAWKDIYVSHGSIIFVDAVTQATSSFSIDTTIGNNAVKYTAAITASQYFGDGSELTNLPSTTNWNNGKEYVVRNTEQLTFSGDYILEDCNLLIEGSETEIEYSPNKYFYKVGSIFIGGNLLVKDSYIQNDGKISVGGELILIGDSQITGSGIII
jgi:hypothetical protein